MVGRRQSEVIGAGTPHRIGAAVGGLSVLGAALTATGAALPWLRTGRVERSAFALARSARTLGLVDTPGARVAVSALFLSPAMVGALIIVWALGHRRSLAAITGAFALVAVGAPLAMARVSRGLTAGPICTLMGGGCCILALIGILLRRDGAGTSTTEGSPNEHL